MNPVQLTSRDFELVEFNDHNGEPCSLQQSSVVLDFEAEVGASAIWLGCKNNAKPHLGREMSPRMHLTREQVHELVERLKNWLDTGSFLNEEEQPITANPHHAASGGRD